MKIRENLHTRICKQTPIILIFMHISKKQQITLVQNIQEY